MSQTPLWVPITVGVLGVLGTLGGAIFSQVWAARREDKRWEQDRTKWELEKKREDLYRSYAERQTIYAELLTALGRWWVTLMVFFDPAVEDAPTSRQEWLAAKEELFHKINTMRLFAPEPVRAAWDKVVDVIVVLETVEDKSDPSLQDRLRSAQDEALNVMRVDLGVRAEPHTDVGRESQHKVSAKAVNR